MGPPNFYILVKPKLKLFIVAEIIPTIVCALSAIVLVLLDLMTPTSGLCLTLIGMAMQIICMLYRAMSYIFALILEVSPAMQNLTDVMRGLFGRK